MKENRKEKRVTLTTHVPHRDLELLPVPSILPFPAMHPDQHGLQLGQPSLRLLAEEVLAYFVPVLLRHLALDAAGLDLVQPFIDGRILGWVAVEDGEWCRPGFEYGLEVQWLGLERFENIHSNN